MNRVRCIEESQTAVPQRQIVAAAAGGRRRIIAGLPLPLTGEDFT